MAELSREEKIKAVYAECDKYTICADCPLHDMCRDLRIKMRFKERAPVIYDAYPNIFQPTALHTTHRITIREIIDLLDYDRTGIRQIRLVDEQTKRTDTLQTDSYLLQYVEDTAVNCIDTVGGVLTMYCDFGEASDGET